MDKGECFGFCLATLEWGECEGVKVSGLEL